MVKRFMWKRPYPLDELFGVRWLLRFKTMLISAYPSIAGPRGVRLTSFLLAQHKLVQWDAFLDTILAGTVCDVVSEWRLGFDADPYKSIELVKGKLADALVQRDRELALLFPDGVPDGVRPWLDWRTWVDTDGS